MNTYIKPTSDILIHYLFGSEHNKDLLLSFINAVLTDADMEPVETVEIKNPFNIKEYRYDKMSILDIKATASDGRIFDIEIQSAGSDLYINRSLYYWAKNYASQLKESEHYAALNPVICINLLDFTLLPAISAVHTCFLATERKNHNFILTDHFEIHYIELSKFYETHQIIKEDLEAWVRYFIHEGTEDEAMKVILSKSTFKKAHNEYVKFNASDEYRELVEARMKWTRDHNTRVELARREGIQEGEKAGIEKGIEKVAIRLLQKGSGLKEISEATGLSVDKIKSLHKNL